MCMHVHELNNQASISLKVVSRKRRRKCTLKSYDRFTNSYDLRLTTKSDRKFKSGSRYSELVNRKPILLKRRIAICIFFNMNINQMKRAIHIRCTQQFREPYKIIKTATHYCLFLCTFFQLCIYNINICY